MQPPIQQEPGAPPRRGVKAVEREADPSPRSNFEVMNEWSSTSTPPMCLHDVDRDFTVLSLLQVATNLRPIHT